MSELVFLFSADADIQTAFEFYEAFQAGRGEAYPCVKAGFLHLIPPQWANESHAAH